jgi:glycosyltransferase involved in cell wall biosynthesis
MKNYSIDDVTVVVIGRNEAKNLPRCFDSIQKITRSIVFVDSNSSDRSVEIAREHGIPMIVALNSNFYSASLGRMVGAKKCETSLIQFLDGDMELDLDWIRTAIQFMNENSRAAILHGFKREYKNEKDLNSFKIKADQRNWRSDYLQGAYLIKRDVYQESGGLDPRFPGEEERDLYVRVHDLGHEVWYIHYLMSSHYDFKDRGWRYLLVSDVAGAVFIPLIKSLKNGKLLAYLFVYRRMLPVLLADVLSLIALLSLSIHGLLAAIGIQATALVYARAIKRPGYFIIWKSALLNVHRTVRVMYRKILFSEHVVTSIKSPDEPPATLR